MASIAALSQTLRILEIADCGINTVCHLTYLGRLHSLQLADNAIVAGSEVDDVCSYQSAY